MLGLARALYASGTLSPRSRVLRAFHGGLAAAKAQRAGARAAALPELRLRSRVWVALAVEPDGAPAVCYRSQDCARLPAEVRRRLQGFPSEAEAKAFVAGAEQPWP